MNEAPFTVAMGCDRTYLYPFAVALTSFVRQAGRSFDLWFGLAADWRQRLSQRELDLALEFAASLGLSVQSVEVPLSVDDLPPTLHISPTAFVKPALFDECRSGQTLVWLDADMIAVRDWTRILDLAADHPVAAVHEAQPSFEAAWPAAGSDWYANTGVVVVDGSRWQETFAGTWRPYLADYSKNGFRYLDQDVLNATIRDGWHLLPQDFNYRLGFSGSCDEPVIIHYAGWWKPWLRTRWQQRRFEPSWRRAFSTYAAAEDDLMDALAPLPPTDRRYWAGQRRSLRGTAGWRAWRHYARGVLRER